MQKSTIKNEFNVENYNKENKLDIDAIVADYNSFSEKISFNNKIVDYDEHISNEDFNFVETVIDIYEKMNSDSLNIFSEHSVGFEDIEEVAQYSTSVFITVLQRVTTILGYGYLGAEIARTALWVPDGGQTSISITFTSQTIRLSRKFLEITKLIMWEIGWRSLTVVVGWMITTLLSMAVPLIGTIIGIIGSAVLGGVLYYLIEKTGYLAVPRCGYQYRRYFSWGGWRTERVAQPC